MTKVFNAHMPALSGSLADKFSGEFIRFMREFISGAACASGTLREIAKKDLTTDEVPAGWRICNGAAVSRTVYRDLFNVIGTQWGTGDGSTTFNLPQFSDSETTVLVKL